MAMPERACRGVPPRSGDEALPGGGKASNAANARAAVLWEACCRRAPTAHGTKVPFRRCQADSETEATMGRYALLWLLGVPIPILLLIWAFGGLH
jgi:hypothetical protein